MGKVICEQKSKKKSKKMSEALVERRCTSKTSSNANNLKRSKSVRASLRLIGNKILHHRNANELQMNNIQKSPSLSSIRDSVEFQRNYFNRENIRNLQHWNYPDSETIETILKTPINEHKIYKNQLTYLNFKKADFLKNKTKVSVSTPPSSIAPKAAAILQIPIRENCESSVSLRRKNVDGIVAGTESSGRRFSSRYGEECDLQGRLDSFAAFQRSTLRLSMNGAYHKRKGMNTAYRSSTSSRLFFFVKKKYLQ